MKTFLCSEQTLSVGDTITPSMESAPCSDGRWLETWTTMSEAGANGNGHYLYECRPGGEIMIFYGQVLSKRFIVTDMFTPEIK